MKLLIVVRLLDGRARAWWDTVRNRLGVPPTWADFLREFDNQYFTRFHQKEKRREFMNLKQGQMTVEEYEGKFNELIPYVPDLVRSDADQASYLRRLAD